MASYRPDTTNTLSDGPSEEGINLAIGRRLRRRRRLLGLTQTDLATSLGLQFQQVQKYECSASRISAARLFILAKVLKVPVNYFFDSLSPGAPSCAEEKDRTRDGMADLLADKETLNLLGAFARLPASVRKRLLVFAKSLGEFIDDGASSRRSFRGDNLSP